MLAENSQQAERAPPDYELEPGAHNLELSRIYNPIMKLVLRSPLHGVMSKNTMLITYTGRRSGKTYTTPVNYLQEDNEITIFSLRHRTWWRNLRDGAQVTVKIKGKTLKATTQAIEDNKTVAKGLLTYLQKRPQYAKYFQVTLNPDGQPNPEEVYQAAQKRVIVKAKLT